MEVKVEKDIVRLSAKNGHAWMRYGISGGVLQILDVEKHTSEPHVSDSMLSALIQANRGVEIVVGELAGYNLEKHKQHGASINLVPMLRACSKAGFPEITTKKQEGKIKFKARKVPA